MIESYSRELEALLSGGDTAGPVTAAGIETAEKELGVEFPESYRLFLEKFGAAVCGPADIAGIFEHPAPDQCPYWQDVVALTKQVRHVSRGHIPNSYIPICDDGGDYMFYLDTAQLTEDGECPVVVLGPGRDGIVAADSFAEFAVRWIKKDLEY